jgi:hypothetical protein
MKVTSIFIILSIQGLKKEQPLKEKEELLIEDNKNKT